MEPIAHDPKPLGLVVDDEPQMRYVITFALETQGFRCVSAASAESAWEKLGQESFDLVILDVMLPGLGGVELCRRIRATSTTPIILLTALGDEEDRIAGLEAGADDYVPKPFKPRELVARVRARLRGREDAGEERIALADLEIDVPGHAVRRGDRLIALTPLEFDLLATLARTPSKVFSREELLEQVWGYRHAADTRLVNVHVQRLRSKIERDPEKPEIVVTVRGVGYRAGTGA